MLKTKRKQKNTDLRKLHKSGIFAGKNTADHAGSIFPLLHDVGVSYAGYAPTNYRGVLNYSISCLCIFNLQKQPLPENKQQDSAIINLREERQSILTEAALKDDLQERMEDLISFLDEQTEAVTEYSEPLARRLIEKITVYDEKLVVEFKSGLTVEVEA